AGKLTAAIAKALLKREIPASDKTTSLGSYQLYGRVVESRPRDGKATLTALWRLYDAEGRAVGERSAKAEAPARDGESGRQRPIEQLAQRSAEALAPLLEEESPADSAATAKDEGQFRIVIRDI